jgi:dihydroneopterin aldolase/2-amino-4-hydroxy-6-hydroxymethyldihydropteridine diphosphokinase/dihydropteroate synthase
MSSSIVNPYSTTSDSVLISSLRLSATIGDDRWSKARLQPITLSLQLETSLAHTGAADDIAHTVDYGKLAKALTAAIDGQAFGSLRELANAALHLAFEYPSTQAARTDVQAHNQFLRADALGVTLFRDKTRGRADLDRVWIRGLAAACIIGVNPAEREFKQNVQADITFDDPGWMVPDWRAMHDSLIQVCALTPVAVVLVVSRAHVPQTIEASSFLTLESLATAVAKTACYLPGASRATIQARKPSALVHASASGVEITRDRTFFER